MLSKLNEWGVQRIIEDSSGNAGASIAAYAAMVGIQADIYVPASTSAGKIAQIEAYGARLVKVPGSREDTTTAAMNAATEIFYASHNWNPYFLAGMKTAAYEIAEQHAWNPPEFVVTPVGGGGLLVGLYLGFRDLHQAGYISRIPRLVAVQAAACDPVFQSWTAGCTEVLPIQKRPTAAEGISVAKPVRGVAILDALRNSNGVVTTVGEDQIWDAMETLGAQGVYVEPTAAAAPAALLQLWEDHLISPDDRVLVMLTGSGLKATDKIVEHQALVGVGAD
jgi:threonine synthase